LPVALNFRLLAANFGLLNIFDPTLQDWTDLSNEVEGDIPVERIDFTLVQVDEFAFLFGGRDLLGQNLILLIFLLSIVDVIFVCLLQEILLTT